MSKVPERSVTEVYATAVYDAAEEAGELARVQQELRLLDEALQRDDKLRLFFETPTISPDEKRRILEKSLADFSFLTRNFISLLLRRERMAAFESIIEELDHYASRLAGIAEVEIETAVPLDDGQRKRLRETLAKRLSRKVRLDEHVRDELLGGAILRHEGMQWNASLLYRLRRLVGSFGELKGSHGAWSE